tara:strand:- start:10445 stop:11695 length:1251 start_codon:yes stop_codon:yes gene_type:complete
MAITLRLSDNTPVGKVTELSYDEMNDNLRSFYYSSSFQNNTLVLHTTGSVSHSISLAAFLDNTNTNIYNTDGTLTGTRTVTLDGNELTFVADQGETFTIATDPGSVVAITDLPTTVVNSTVGIDPLTGQLSAMSTGSMNYYSSASVNLNTLTLHRGNGGTSVVTVDTGSGGGSTSPGGSNLQVQFNDSSNFGGDSQFTFNKTSGTVVITTNGTGATETPQLTLISGETTPTINDVLGVIEAGYPFELGVDYPAILFKGDGTWTAGNYPARIDFATVGTSAASVKMSIKGSGRVGIGTTNPLNGFLEVTGDVSGTSIYASANVVAYSDARSKTNIETIPNALNKVTSIRGVTYNKVEDPDGVKYMGVVAQELLPYLPEVVVQGESGEYAVAYGNIVGVLIEAIKELKAEIDELKANK